MVKKTLETKLDCEYIGDGRTICAYVLQTSAYMISCSYLKQAKCTYEPPKVTLKYKIDGEAQNTTE